MTNYMRANYRKTGAKLDASVVARGAKTPSDPAYADTANSYCIYVSTGLVSPIRGIAFPAQSQTGMSAKRYMFYAGVTGSYLKFNAMIMTRTGAGYFCVPAATTTFCFTWMAFEQ